MPFWMPAFLTIINHEFAYRFKVSRVFSIVGFKVIGLNNIVGGVHQFFYILPRAQSFLYIKLNFTEITRFLLKNRGGNILSGNNIIVKIFQP